MGPGANPLHLFANHHHPEVVGAVGFEPTISCSQSTCVSHYATPRRFALGNRMCLSEDPKTSLHRFRALPAPRATGGPSPLARGISATYVDCVTGGSPATAHDLAAGSIPTTAEGWR